MHFLVRWQPKREFKLTPAGRDRPGKASVQKMDGT